MNDEMSDPRNIERIEVFPDPSSGRGDFEQWQVESGNADFRKSTLTWFSLILLLILYPGSNLLFTEDPTAILRNLDETMRMVLLIGTIIIQWVIFLIIFGTAARERTGLAGLGFTRFQFVHFLWAVSFLIASNLILAGLSWLLAQIGLPMPGEIEMLIPEDTAGRIVWVVVSATAGICEETAFRGYLMTRLRLVGRFHGWVVVLTISSLAFGACHVYQGLPGFIVITVYGALFALLFIRTGSLWPCIIAHFFQDVGALFFPY